MLPRRERSAFERGRALWWPHRLDRDALHACAALLPGTHDFTAFTPTETDHVRFSRDVLGARWEERGDLLEFWIEADTFMRHMNRALVGTMLEVAGGRRSVEDFAALLDGASNSSAGRRPPATSSIVRDEDAVHVAHERVGLDPELEQVAVALATRRREHVALEAHVVGLGGRERGEVVRARQRRGARVAARRGRARCGHHSARPRSNGDGAAPREHAVAVGAASARRGGRRSRPARLGTRSTATSSRQQRVERAQPAPASSA